MASRVASSATSAVVGCTGAAGTPPSLHDTSAGRISVATWPGGPIAAATACAASSPSFSVEPDVRTQVETLRATVSMSDCNCASYLTW